MAPIAHNLVRYAEYRIKRSTSSSFVIDHRARGITLYYEIIFQGVYRSPLSFCSSISDLNVDNNLGAKTDFSVLRLYYTRSLQKSILESGDDAYADVCWDYGFRLV